MKYYKVLSSENQQITTDEILHPGDVLEMELMARGIKKNFAALQLGIRPSHLSDLLNRKRHVSALLAIKLQLFLGISADFWMRVQAGYDLAIAWQQMADSPMLQQYQSKQVI
jgi:antitoxin HigA-1